MTGDIVIAGCGNLLRGDDAAGPILVRKIWELGCPSGVRLVDGGTAGMDVAFQMDGAKHVVIVDACKSDSEPGTVFEIPGEDVEAPPLEGMNLHAFRWDNAIAFARWLLKDRYPEKVTVILIEAQQLDHGAPLSDAVSASVERVARDLIARFTPTEVNGSA
jgi:hydrogenase maturation protease